MGGLKEYYLEREEENGIRLAAMLRISWEELSSLDYEVLANVSKDGLIYNYILRFAAESNKGVINKIYGIDKNLSVDLPAWIFERSVDEEYELNAISENTDYMASFLREISHLNQLRALTIDSAELKDILLRQIFISIIGAVETYLSDAFINRTMSSDFYLENFVRTNPEFKKQKISISEVFEISRSIRERAKSLMIGTIYHKLPIVKEMYEQTFGIKFPDISAMQKYVVQRHDLVHRNGKTVDGQFVLVDDCAVSGLSDIAEDFIVAVSEALDDDNIPF